MANIDAAAVKQAVQRHPDFIVGLKARMSSSVVGENGITPLELNGKVYVSAGWIDSHVTATRIHRFITMSRIASASPPASPP